MHFQMAKNLLSFKKISIFFFQNLTTQILRLSIEIVAEDKQKPNIVSDIEIFRFYRRDFILRQKIHGRYGISKP